MKNNPPSDEYLDKILSSTNYKPGQKVIGRNMKIKTSKLFEVLTDTITKIRDSLDSNNKEIKEDIRNALHDMKDYSNIIKDDTRREVNYTNKNFESLHNDIKDDIKLLVRKFEKAEKAAESTKKWVAGLTIATVASIIIGFVGVIITIVLTQ